VDPLDLAKDGIRSLLLCLDIHLDTILLIFKGDGHIFDLIKRAVLRQGSFLFVAKNNIPDGDLLGPPWHPRGSVFAGAHSEKECHDGEVGSHCHC
jgi:hypothetical protein